MNPKIPKNKFKKLAWISGVFFISWCSSIPVIQSESKLDVQTSSDAVTELSESSSKQVILIEPTASIATVQKVLKPFEVDLNVSYVDLGALSSLPGETFEAFLVRTAQSMDWFTRESGYEACGVIMSSQTQDAWQIRITTNRSRISCEMVEYPLEGYTKMDADIHSHPYFEEPIYANAQDIHYNKSFACGQQMFIFDERFSKKDFSRGEGYLVSRNRLLYQHGEKWPIRQVNTFESLKEAPELSAPYFAGVLPNEVDFNESNEPLVVRVDPIEAAATAVWLNQVEGQMVGVPNVECPVKN